MTKICKEILETLKINPDHTLMYEYVEDNELFPDMTEFYDAVRYLEKQGLVEFVSNQDGIHLGIRASHVAMHPVQLGKHPFLHWLFRDYFGGVLIGVTGTLLSETLLTLISETVRRLLLEIVQRL